MPVEIIPERLPREYLHWHSTHLNRTMEILVFGDRGAKVLVFPTRGGRFYEYENMRMIQALHAKIAAGYLQIWCIDSVDEESFYCWWAHPSGRLQRHQQYESYILQEVLPLMQQRNPDPTTIAHGCSLGAYHAASMAFRHPKHFQKLVAFSGRYDLTWSVEHFPDLLDGHYDENVYYYTPTHFLPHLECPEQLEAMRSMEMIFTIGAEDPFRPNAEHLSQILHSKAISHQMIVWGGRAHEGYSWRRMAPIYL
jgi:esterase/lipase superfamily enzyme